MSEAMHAEFDTVAEWTADVALDLGPDYYLPAGCRGSGSPGVLRWLLYRLQPAPGERLLDCGAGVGGPAAFAALETGVTPVLTDPELGACRAAHRLFGLPVVQAGSALPFADESLDAAWALGVVCTVPDQLRLLAELRRVLRPAARLGLLVFTAQRPPVSSPPSGNHFPTEDGLRRLLDDAGLRLEDSASGGDFADTPPEWQQRADVVDAELVRRHGDDPAWRTAEDQSTAIGRLLIGGELSGTLLVARRPERS